MTIIQMFGGVLLLSSTFLSEYQSMKFSKLRMRKTAK